MTEIRSYKSNSIIIRTMNDTISNVDFGNTLNFRCSGTIVVTYRR